MPIELQTFLQSAFSQGSRSTVLKPLAWIISILSASTISSFSFRAPIWVGTMFGVFSGLSMLLYLVAYVFFAWTDKDSLRSEKFFLQKMAIEKGFIGDDMTGYIKIVDPLSGKATPELPEPSKEDEK